MSTEVGVVHNMCPGTDTRDNVVKKIRRKFRHEKCINSQANCKAVANCQTFPAPFPEQQ